MPPEVVTITPSAEMARGLFVSVMAMMVVFSVLAAIAALMFVMGKIAEFAGRTKRPAAVPSPLAHSSAVVDAATMAAITAAVALVMKGKRFRIARLAGYDVQTARWAMAGRQRLLKKG